MDPEQPVPRFREIGAVVQGAETRIQFFSYRLIMLAKNGNRTNPIISSAMLTKPEMMTVRLTSGTY